MSESTGPASADQEVTIRRAPRIGVFLVVGGMLGALVTLILTSLFEPDPNVGFAGSFGYFLIFGLPAGVLLGALVALIIDASSRRRTRAAVAVRDVVEEEPEPEAAVEEAEPEGEAVEGETDEPEPRAQES